jgi:hypothetical protein
LQLAPFLGQQEDHRNKLLPEASSSPHCNSMLIAAAGWLHQLAGESCSNLEDSRQETEDFSWSPSVAVLQQSVQYR